MKFKYTVAIEIEDLEFDKKQERLIRADLMNKIFDAVDGLMKRSNVEAMVTVKVVGK